MSPLQMFFVDDPKAAPLQMDALADTCAEMGRVACPECFPPRMLVPSPKPLKITGADHKHIFGGEMGVFGGCTDTLLDRTRHTVDTMSLSRYLYCFNR